MKEVTFNFLMLHFNVNVMMKKPMTVQVVTRSFIASNIFYKLVHYVLSIAIQFPQSLLFLDAVMNSTLPSLSGYFS
jgi:hypothetical protein